MLELKNHCQWNLISVSMTIFDQISPLDYRYATEEKILKYLSEEARVKYQAKVEAALAQTLAKHGICSEEAAKEITEASEKVTAEKVYAEEKRIKHDIRALANIIRDQVSDKAKPFVHFSATSYDIVDTSSALRFKEATDELMLPILLELEKAFIELAEREAETIQVGRTHGQHAEPITFGFAIAEYVSRLGGRIRAIENAKEGLVGQFSGAVGAYNASRLFVKDPEEFEKDLLKSLGLKPGSHSTQIVEGEPLADLIHAYISCFSVIANFADDMRNLQRTEISEVAESFGKQQVGSSTMPHKRNPITFENIKSMWKQFMPRMSTVYMDQISEHQRDLTNSASARFLPEILAALYVTSKKLTKVVNNMVVDKESMNRNFNFAADKIVAEPLYLLLAAKGHEDAHEYVRKLTLEAGERKIALEKVIEEKKDTELKPYFEKFNDEQKELLRDPSKYIGISAEKAKSVCAYWKKELKL